MNHHRLEIRVEDHGQHRVLERTEHGLVDDCVRGAPQLPDLLPCAGQRENDVGVTNSTSKYGFAADSRNAGIVRS